MRIKILLFVLLVGQISNLMAQTNEECLDCHNDDSLTMEKKGKEVSIYVDESVLQKSTHSKLVCVACHTGFDPWEMPHKEKIRPINCMTSCHKDAPLSHPFHPQMIRASGTNGPPDVSCKTCHGTHQVVSPQVPGAKFHASNLTEGCGECHAAAREKFVGSAHSKALTEGVTSAPNCITCHQNRISRLTPGQSRVQLKIVQEKVCLSCHLDNPDVRARIVPSAGFIAAYEQSVHGAALLKGNGDAANCIDCHGSHEIKKGVNPTAHISKRLIPETCAKCHQEIAQEFAGSIHATAAMQGSTDAPVCTDCHGEHNILAPTDPRSPVAPANVSAQVCSPCHSSVRLTEKYGIPSDRFQSFFDSFHGLAIRGGSVEVANCASCHGAHNIKPSSDPTSSVHKANLATTCGKCHPGANARFAIGTVHLVVTEQKSPLLYWVTTFYIMLIVVLVGGMFIHNLFDFIKRSRHRLHLRRGTIAEEPVGHDLYVRMTLNERLQHGVLLVSFTILAITGFMLRYPDAWWVIGMRRFSDALFDLRSLIHRSAAVVMVLVSLYHFCYVCFTVRGRQLIRDLMPRQRDLLDALDLLKYNLGLSKYKPWFGRFSYIEKLEYWAVVWGTVVMAITGVIMWFENTFIGLLTKLAWDIAWAIHFYEAWLAMLAIIVWHLYHVIFNPDVYPMNLAWIKGTLNEAEMAEEHPLELAEIRRRQMEEGLSQEEKS